MLEYVSVNQIDPGKELYNKVKAGFIIKGTTLGAWCRQSGVKQQTLCPVLSGLGMVQKQNC